MTTIIEESAVGTPAIERLPLKYWVLCQTKNYLSSERALHEDGSR
jgi:hypothetical protein